MNGCEGNLVSLGLKKEDHIAIWAANIPEWLLIEMAEAKVGLVLVTINLVLQAGECARSSTNKNCATSRRGCSREW